MKEKTTSQIFRCHKRAQIIIGDVVATGTSLRHGLDIMIKEAVNQGTELGSILFFTIGRPMSEERLLEALILVRHMRATFNL